MRGLLTKVVRFFTGKCELRFAPLVRNPETILAINTFEERHLIKLPEEYVGALLSPHLISPFDPLVEWCQPSGEEEMSPGFLASPFPHSDAWNDLALFDEDKGWQSPYFEDHWWQGAMRVTNLGCEGYTLLVISGHCRGQLWCDLRVPEMKGIFPLTNQRGQRVFIQDAWKGLKLHFGRKADISSPAKYFASFTQTKSQ